MATDDDERAESASTVTATLDGGDGYAVDADAASASVTVADDDAAPVVVRVEFARMQQVPVDQVMRLLTESQGSIRLDPQRPNCLLIDTGTIGLRENRSFSATGWGLCCSPRRGQLRSGSGCPPRRCGSTKTPVLA